MSISLERLIDVIDKIKSWVLAGLAAPFISKLVLDFFGIKPMGALSVVLEHQTVLVIGIFASSLLIAPASKFLTIRFYILISFCNCPLLLQLPNVDIPALLVSVPSHPWMFSQVK